MEFPEGSAAGSGGLGQVAARQRLGCPSGRERERKEVSADVRGAGAGARSTPMGRGSRGWRGGRGVVFPASPGIWTRIHLSAAGEGAGEEQPADQGWRLLCQPSRAVQDRALRCCCCCLEAAPKEPSSFQGLASSLSQTLQLGRQEPVGV